MLIYSYKGWHGCDASCGLEITRNENRTLVVCTELPDNPGTSITNMAETLATLVCKEYSIDPQYLTWIEHYPARRPPLGDTLLDQNTYDLVTFDLDVATSQFSKPKWKRLSDAELQTHRDAHYV